MPLVNSPSNAARKINVRREIDAGRKPAQAVAIAYSVQRKAKPQSYADKIRQAAKMK